jgi:PAS domain S-box-containing protein
LIERWRQYAACRRQLRTDIARIVLQLASDDAEPIALSPEDVVRWFGTNTDVTLQIEAEKQLRWLNQSLEYRVAEQTKERDRIWNVSQDLLVVADTNGRLLSINPAWTATLGWSESDLLGKTADWLCHPDDMTRTHAELARLVGGRRTLLFENRLRHRDSSYR